MELRTPLKPIGEPARPSPKRWVLVFTGIGILILILAIVAFFAYRNAFSAPEKNAESERFIIALNSNDKEIIERLWICAQLEPRRRKTRRIQNFKSDECVGNSKNI